MEPKYNKMAIKIASEIILSEQKEQSVSNATKIAQQIYDSKGVLWDDEASALKAIQKIKNVQLYKEVLKALQNLTGGRGIGQYLASFTTVPQRLDIVNHLASVIPKSQWPWSIEKIMPWSDFKYAGSKIYSDATAGQNNAKTKLIAYYSDKGLWKDGGPNIDTEFWKDYHHEILMGAEALAYLIPVPVLNVAIATAIAGIDAKMYWDEGDRYSAGLMATLTAIPLIGSLAKLGLKPLIKSLGKNGLKKFISNLKLIKAGQKPALTKTEQELIKKMGSDGNRKLIQQEVNAYYKKLTVKQTVKQVGKDITVGLAKGVAGSAAWNKLYTEMGLDVAEMTAQLAPIIAKMERAITSESGKILATSATPGLQQGVFSRLPKLEQIIREEYQLMTEKEATASTTTSTDYSKVKTPFEGSSRDIENFRNYIKWKSGTDSNVKKDYDRLKSKMTGGDVTTADKEMYSLHKANADKWWKWNQADQEAKQDEASGWMPDLSTLIQTTIGIEVVKTLLNLLIGAVSAATGLYSVIGLRNLLKNKQGNIPSTSDAIKIGRLWKIMPKLTRYQVKEMLKSLKLNPADFNDSQIYQIQNEFRRRGRSMIASECRLALTKLRRMSIQNFIKNPLLEKNQAQIMSYLTTEEQKMWKPILDKYVQLTAKYGDSSWATKWFR